MDWVDKTMASQVYDESIIWKATNMHHPMFGLHYLDYQVIIKELLPKLKTNKYDAFFAGHEHLAGYAFNPVASDYLDYTTTRDI